MNGAQRRVVQAHQRPGREDLVDGGSQREVLLFVAPAVDTMKSRHPRSLRSRTHIRVTGSLQLTFHKKRCTDCFKQG